MDCGPLRPDDEDDVVEVHAGDGTVIRRYPRAAPTAPVAGVPYPTDPFLTVQLPVSARSVPRTGLAGHVRRDPAVLDMLAKEADRLRQRAAQYAPRPVPADTYPRTLDVVLAAMGDAVAGMTGGLIDLSGHMPRPTPPPVGARRHRPSVWARYWAWNRRAFAWLARHLLRVLICLTTLVWAVVLLAGLATGWGAERLQEWSVCQVILVGALGGLLALRREERELEAIVAEIDTFADAMQARARLRWQDVELVEFAAVCACPACGAERFHYLAAADVIPDVEVETFDRLVVWRDCASWDNPENPCGFVWPQLR